MASRARKSGAACVRCTIRCAPFACTPETGVVDAPTTSDMNAIAGDCIFGSASRSKTALKLAAVTGWPFENFVKLAFTVKSYVLPLSATRG